MNLNPIDFTYIDGENIYPLQDYVDEQISQLSSAGITTCNVIIDNQKLNDVIYFSTSNLYLKNKIPNGDIFISPFFNYPDSGVVGVKVDYTGKLLVYHNYNLLQPTFGAGYYDVEGEIIQLKADGINTDLQLTGLEAAVLSLQSQIDNNLAFTEEIVKDVNCLVNFNNLITQDTLQLIGRSGDFAVTSYNYARVVGEIKNIADNVRFNAIVTGAAVSATFGLAGAAIASAATYIYYQNASNTIYNNSNFTINQKNTLYNANTSNEVASYSNYNFSMCNLNIQNGFINSNITNQQFIPSLSTNAISFNGYNISNVFLPRGGGTLTGSVAFDRGSVGTPATGYFGSIGDRIVHYLGTPTSYPYSTGIATSSLWNSVPTSCTHDWYVNGTKTMTLDNDKLVLSGTIPHLQLTTTNGNNLGYATANGYFSTSALAGDVVLRGINNLILQSGLDAALIINKTTNTVDVKTTLLTSNFIYKGVEINLNTSNLSRLTILGSTPNVSKKYMFQFTCSTSIVMPNNVTYYKYDIDLRNYTQLKYIPNPNTPYRIFKIKLWMANGYFQYLYQNNKYNVLSYEVYMSNQSQNGGGGMGSAGINVRAFGFPESSELNTITPTQIILVRSADFNYVSCLSIFNTALVNAIIEDVLF